MNLSVEYRDSMNKYNQLTFNINKVAFVKHLAFAGQDFAPKLQKLLRTLGMLLHYGYYLESSAMNNDYFSTPPIFLSDPTEKAQFSNLAGKAIADYLSKMISKSILTMNYEAALRILNIPIQGQRPDLIAFSRNYTYAIEAKGYTNGHGDMSLHKLQAMSAHKRIHVDFAIACVSYNIYNKIKCNYYDPSYDMISSSSESFREDDLFRNISRQYYKGLSTFLVPEYFKISDVKYSGEEFYEIELFSKYLNNGRFIPRWLYQVQDLYNPRLLITKKVEKFAKDGITRELPVFESIQEGTLYIDADRVGLRLERA